MAAPGRADSCPSCGHPFLEGPAAAPVRAARVSPGLIRTVVYAVIIFGAARYFARLYAAYLDAEQERVESALLGQALERKKEMRLAEQEIDEADGPARGAEETASKP